MGENKTFNLKDKTSLKRFAKHPIIHIHIKFCVGNSSCVNIWLQTGSGMAKFLIFSRNIQKFVSMQMIFFGATLEPEWKCVYSYVRM
jgi:hypothetical protein